MLIPKSERVCCPIWATHILSPAADRLNRIDPRTQVIRVRASDWDGRRWSERHLELPARLLINVLTFWTAWTWETL